MKNIGAYGLLLSLTLTGCGKRSCQYDGDNVEGRVNFSERAEPLTDKRIIIQSSSNGFAQVFSLNTKTNHQGFLTVAYTVCAPENVPFFVRAFQDGNDNGVHDFGEPAGRHDGTTDSNGTYISRTVVNNAANDEWHKVSGVDITLDSTEGL